jgi:hypothetical protein
MKRSTLRLASALAISAVAAGGAFALAPAFKLAAHAASAPAPSGDYLELRDASVFAGACHTGSEWATQNRRALLVAAIEAGHHGGQDLGGVRLMSAVEADDSLAGAAVATRRSLLVIDAPRGGSQAQAAEAWWRARAGAALGEVVEVLRGPVVFEVEGLDFEVRVGDGLVSINGAALADGSCCSMPDERWYEPLAAPAGATVGVPRRAHFAGHGPLAAWRFEDHNSAFLTRL